MPLAQRARQAGVLVRRLSMPGEDLQGILSELGALFPKYVFCFDMSEGLTVLVPSSARANWSGVAQRQGLDSGASQLLVPQALVFGVAWLIEVDEHQLILHKCREGHDDDIVHQFQKAMGLVTDGIIGARTRAAMRALAAGVDRHPAVPEPEPERPSKWERLMGDD